MALRVSGENRLSLCMIVKNEEKNLRRCLKSVAGLVDETIIVDTGSSDNTVEIAKSFGAKVIEHPWHDDFAEARNIALAAATGNWILVMDADEELVPSERTKLRTVMILPFAGFLVNIISYSGERISPYQVESKSVRIFKNLPEHRYTGALHEQIAEHIKGKIGDSGIRFKHYGYLDSEAERQNKSERNLAILRKEIEQKGENAFLLYCLGMEYMRLYDYRRAGETFEAARQKVEDRKAQYVARLYRNLIVCLVETKQYKEAIEVANEAIGYFPDYTDIYFLIANLYLGEKFFEEAVEPLQICVRLGECGNKYISDKGGGSYLAWLGLGVAFKYLGRKEEAKAALTTALNLEPRLDQALDELVGLMLEDNSPYWVRKTLRKIVNEKDVEGALNRVHSSVLQGNVQTAG